MKKIVIFSALVIALIACGGNSSTDTSAANTDTGDAGLTNPKSIDTTKHPDGVINGSVISTDTAAMNTQNAINKAKGAKDK